MRYVLLCVLACLIISCEKDYNSNPLHDILNSNHPAIRAIMDNLESHEVQIKVSEIINSETRFEELTYNFQVDDHNYFYPASSVKFPIAVLALEKVNTIKQINSNTPFIIEDDSIFSSIRDNVKAIFVLSDNEAYNRLYEFLGRDYINKMLEKKDLQPARISHRLESQNAENYKTKPIVFRNLDSIYYIQNSILNSKIKPLKLNKLKKGKSYYKKDSLINQPMDFANKNYLPISTLHEIMKRVQFPKAFPTTKRFIINKSDQEFLFNVMKSVPRKFNYNESEYYDGYVKFFMFGDTKKRIPEHIEISNKVGYAYGYLTDCALIEDKKNEIAFLITATIHVNNNRIFNDNIYEYESIGIPFLAEVGRQLHQYYVQRKLSTKLNRD